MKIFSIILLSFVLSSFAIEIAGSAKAKIYVINESNEVVEGAKVTLYKTHENYKSEKHPAASGVTNQKGFVEFKNLEEIVYYLHVRKGHHNNHQGHIQTDTLRAKGKNRFEIMID